MESRVPVRRRQIIPRVTPRELYDVIVDFAAYPRLFPEIKETRVLSRTGDVTRVEFRSHMVLPIRYVLDLVCVPAALTVDWTYVEGEIVSSSVGSWRFQPQGDGTDVEYAASTEVRAPVPGFIMRRIIDGLVSASLPAMWSSLEHEIRRRQAAPARAPEPSTVT
jgi:ribosome-associated toxin RatA of RatAB toxin-antitoxin module